MVSLKNDFRSRASVLALAVAAVCGAASLGHAADLTTTGAGAADVAAGAAAADADVSAVDAIIVTGTRASGVKALEATAPVNVVSADAIATTGAADLNSALQLAVPSINFPQVTIGSAAGANLNVTLRGLAPDQTLVLVDGFRQHKSAFVNVKPGASRGSEAVDLSTLPVSAIDRVEVLRDAAAAQYGSDAIAGVVNIVLRDRPDGGGIKIRTGAWQDGDGKTTYIQAWKGLPLPNGGAATLSLDLGEQGDTNQFISPETRNYYFAGDPREATVNKQEFYRGQPQIRLDARGVLTATQPITDNLTFKGFGSYAEKRTRIDGNPLLPNDNATLRAFYPDGVRPNQWVFNKDYTLAGKLQWDAKAIGRFELGADYGDDRQAFKTTSSDNASLGLNSPTAFKTGSLANRQVETTLDWVRDTRLPFAQDPITLSAGAAWRRERFSIGAGELASYQDGHVPILDGPNAGKAAPYGSNTWQAYLPTDAGSLSRAVEGAYVGAEGHLTQALKFSLTGRAEHYSDFGDVETGQASARYDLTPWFALRGSVSSGVRAPTLGQSRYTYIQTTTLNGQTTLYQVKTFPVSAPAAVALGAAPLKPEKSLNYSLGGVFRAGAGSLTIDAYQIKIRDRIALSDNFSGTAVTALLVAADYPQAVGANFFTNALDTRTRGVSLSGLYHFDLGDWGKLDANLGADFNETAVTKIRTVNGKAPIGRQTAGYIQYGTPDKKIILGGNWSKGPVSVDLQNVFYGHYKQLDTTNPALDQTFHNQDVVNLSVSYAVTPQLKLTVGADNLFGSTPDTLLSWRTAGGLPATPQNPVSWDGRFAWAQLAYNF